MDGITQLIGILEAENENQRLELEMESGETPRLALKLATYSEGLGWHTQKTIYIDGQQAEQLHFLLGGARHLLKQAKQKQQRTRLRPARATALEIARKSA